MGAAVSGSLLWLGVGSFDDPPPPVKKFAMLLKNPPPPEPPESEALEGLALVLELLAGAAATAGP
jgi:hypothetical protein